MKYQDFTLRIRDFQRQQFNVEVLGSPVGQMRSPETATYGSAALAYPLSRLEIKRLRQPALIALGEMLADLLLPGEVRTMLLRSLDALDEEEGLRLRLLINEPVLANLPWEYVYLARSSGEKELNGFLALDPRISLVRYEALERKPGVVASSIKGRPLKLVVGLAAPIGEAPLDLQRERTSIERALAAVDGIDTTFIDHLTVEKLEATIGGAHLFHFAGHGTFSSGAAGVDDTRHLRPVVTDEANDETTAGAGQLIFEDGAGQRRPFPAAKLAQNLATVRLVVLGACETGRRDGINIWSGIAPALMRVGIPAAVAMQYEVYDQSAIAFARRFYGAIAAGLALDEAVTAGRLAILNLDVPFDLDFGVPVLYLRAPDGALFPEVTADETLIPQRQQVRLAIRQRIQEIRGRATGVKGEEIQRGEVTVDQEVTTVTETGDLTGATFGVIGSASPDIDQGSNARP